MLYVLYQYIGFLLLDRRCKSIPASLNIFWIIYFEISSNLVKVARIVFSSVPQLCLTLCDPMNRSTPGLPVHHNSWRSLRLTSIESVMPSSHLIVCHPLLLLPPIPPSIRVFSNESTLHMRWPKYWSFSFGLAKKCVWIFPLHLTERPKRTFWPTQ